MSSDPVGPTDKSRRELLGAMVRWSVPTVVTIALGPRVLSAAVPSCPPCTRKNGGKCKACSMSQILNCQCEPCLGAPYCTGSTSANFSQAANAASSGRAGPGDAPGLPQVSPGGGYDVRTYERVRGTGLRGPTSNDPLTAPLYADPFNTDRRYRGLGQNPFDGGSLYGRLRGDTISLTRRRP